jgi:hypothetical protein
MKAATPLDLPLLRVLGFVVLMFSMISLSSTGNGVSGIKTRVGARLSSEAVVEVLMLSTPVPIFGVVLGAGASVGLGLRKVIEHPGSLDGIWAILICSQ